MKARVAVAAVVLWWGCGPEKGAPPVSVERGSSGVQPLPGFGAGDPESPAPDAGNSIPTPGVSPGPSVFPMPQPDAGAPPARTPDAGSVTPAPDAGAPQPPPPPEPDAGTPTPVVDAGMPEIDAGAIDDCAADDEGGQLDTCVALASDEHGNPVEGDVATYCVCKVVRAHPECADDLGASFPQVNQAACPAQGSTGP